MKRTFKSYTTFTRAERMGLVGLSGLLLLLIAVNIMLPYIVKPSINDGQDKQLITAWEKFKDRASEDTAKQTTTSDTSNSGHSIPVASIDLNNADSTALIELDGIGPATAHKIVEWRKYHGPFTSYDQLRHLGRFSAATFAALKQQLAIGNVKQH